MKLSNEVRIGILAIVAIAMSFWGYTFIKGRNALQATNLYYVEYDDVSNLSDGTPVTISGLQVGTVTDRFLKPDDPNQRVVVVLDLKKGTKVPKNTTALLLSTSFLGGKAIELEYARPCAEGDCAPGGSYLKGEVRGLLSSLVTEEQATTYVNILKDGVQDVLDTLNQAIMDENSSSPISQSLRDLRYSMGNLRSSTSQLDILLKRSSGSIEGTLANLSTVTSTLKQNNERIKSIIVNADNFSSDLVEADLKSTIQNVKVIIDSLKYTLGTANSAISGVNTAIGRVNAGEGSLGKIMKDDTFFNKIQNLTNTVDTLTNDIQRRPYRYIPFKSKKRVERYDREEAKKKAAAAVTPLIPAADTVVKTDSIN